jgi:hypothetical protein
VRKAWKWLLAAVGIPLLCFGLLGIDSYFRAVTAIAAHDARLAKDIAAQRARHGAAVNTGGVFEGGHSATFASWAGLTRAPVDLPGDMGRFLGDIVGVHNFYRETGYAGATEHQEDGALGRIQALLYEGLPAAELRAFSEKFDQIRSTRPSLADYITDEYLLDRAEVLNVLHRKEDRYCMIRRSPGWREFFSWRIMIAKALNELDDLYVQMRPIGSLPYPEAIKAGFPTTLDELEPDFRSRTYLRGSAHRMAQGAAYKACSWDFTRVALALCRFQAEKGRDPQDLKDLVPEYLPRMPVCPYGGAPYEFQKGQLRDVASTATWSLPLK